MNAYLCRFCEGDEGAPVEARSAGEAAMVFCRARPGNIPVPVQLVLVQDDGLSPVGIYRVTDNGWSGQSATLLDERAP